MQTEEFSGICIGQFGDLNCPTPVIVSNLDETSCICGDVVRVMARATSKRPNLAPRGLSHSSRRIQENW